MKLWLLLVCLCGAIAEKRLITPDVTYRVTVATGDVGNAGTLAHVYMSITGDSGVTKELTLDRGKDGFQRGRVVDQMDLKAEDVGKLTSIYVRRDNHGPFPGWNLEKITIKVGQAVYEFPCRCWFAEHHSQTIHVA